MSIFIDDMSILHHRVNQTGWQPVFAKLTASEFGQLLEQVHLEVNQVPVATLVAANCTAFSCQHVVKALSHCSTMTRPTMVEQLFPYCTDLKENHKQITNKLSDWDKMATESALQEALRTKI